MKPGRNCWSMPRKGTSAPSWAQHADPADPGPVDQQVLRREVEPPGHLGPGLVGVLQPLQVVAHVLAGEPEGRRPRRVDERPEVGAHVRHPDLGCRAG